MSGFPAYPTPTRADAPSADWRAPRESWRVRLPYGVRVLIVAVVWVVGYPAIFLVVWTLGYAGDPAGWVWAAVSLAPLVLLTRLLLPDRGARGIAALVVAILLALAGGIDTAGAVPLSEASLRHAAAAIELPAGSHLVDEHTWGNSWCFDECPELDRTYEVADPAAAVATVSGALRSHGWREGSSWTRGRVTVTVTAEDPDRIVLLVGNAR
jgi:hypothetical protein